MPKKTCIESIVGGTRHGLLDMSWNKYRAFPGLNVSTIVHGRKSMLELKHVWDQGIKDTDAMQFGRIVHCLLFEPKEVKPRYWPWEGARKGNEYKLLCAQAAAAGAEVVKASGQNSLAAAIEAAQGFLRNKRVKELIKAGKAEQAVLSTECGLQCKGRLDWISTAEKAWTDLKTTANIEEEVYGKQFFRLGYDIKLGLYKHWADRETGRRWPVEVIVLESKPPYDVVVEPIPDSVLERGVERGMEIIKDIKQCIKEDHWPGVAGDSGVRPLYVPYHEMQEEYEEYQG